MPEPTTPNTPEAVAAAIAADVQSGSLSKAEGDAHLAKLNLPTPAASPPVTSPAPVPAEDPAAVLDVAHRWSPREQDLIRQDLDAALADGRITQEQHAADLKMAGIGPVPLDNRTPEARAIDQQFPPAQPTEFVFPSYGAPGQDVTMTPAMRAFDTEARAALSYARFPRELGSTFAKEADRAASEYANLSPAERELHYRGQVKILQDTWKGDAYTNNLAMANQLFREMAEEFPRLGKALIESGAGSSARVIALLHQQAERLSRRQPE